MHWFKFHVGDYAAATSHLSILEDGAYSRLLRIYYRDEKPLPAELKAVQRLAGARSRDEREAVQTVLAEFFELEADGWHNRRADTEIAAALDTQGDAEERRTHERDRKRRYRERRRALFEQLRALEIVPPFDTPIEDLEGMLSHGTGPGQAWGRPQSGTANQTPDARHQDLGKEHAYPSVSPVETTPRELAVSICTSLKAKGCARTNPSDREFIKAIDAGVTKQEFEDAADLVLEQGLAHRNPFGYVVTMALNHHRALQSPLATAPTMGGVT